MFQSKSYHIKWKGWISFHCKIWPKCASNCVIKSNRIESNRLIDSKQIITKQTKKKEWKIIIIFLTPKKTNTFFQIQFFSFFSFFFLFLWSLLRFLRFNRVIFTLWSNPIWFIIIIFLLLNIFIITSIKIRSKQRTITFESCFSEFLITF